MDIEVRNKIVLCSRYGTERNIEAAKVCPLCFGERSLDTPANKIYHRQRKRRLARNEQHAKESWEYHVKHKDDPEYKARRKEIMRKYHAKIQHTEVLRRRRNERNKRYWAENREERARKQQEYRANRKKLQTNPIPDNHYHPLPPLPRRASPQLEPLRSRT
jgi:hypothetical protein